MLAVRRAGTTEEGIALAEQMVEFDGLVKYEGREGRLALADEKVREDRLRAAGYAVVRLVWADLYRPDVVRARIEQALKGAAA